MEVTHVRALEDDHFKYTHVCIQCNFQPNSYYVSVLEINVLEQNLSITPYTPPTLSRV